MPGEPPPDPFRSSSWSTLISGLGLSWSSVTTIGGVAYGRLVAASGTNYYLFPEGAGTWPSNGVCWTIDSTLPGWGAEHLMTSASATVILNGTDATDGSQRTVYSGTSYKLCQEFVGSNQAVMQAVGA